MESRGATVNTVIGTVFTAVFVFTGVAGFVGGGIGSYLQQGDYRSGAIIGAISGTVGTSVFITIMYFASSLPVYGVAFYRAEMVFVLLNGILGILGGVVGTLLYRIRYRQATSVPLG